MDRPPALRARLAAVLAVTLLAACSAPTAQPSPPPPTSGPTTQPSPSIVPAPEPTTRAQHERITYEDNSYDIVTLDLAAWDVRVDWTRAEGGTLLIEAVEAGDDVVVATNAGIFTPSFTPGGLLVSDGEQLRALNLSEGGGNFHLMPNGVFAVYEDGTAAVMESSTYQPEGVLHATQSGPALLLDGQIHPEFREFSSNLFWRSGVGVSPDGSTVYLAITNHLVNFHTFARMFRDHLGCEDALYLDGNISGMWVEGVREFDAGFGPFAGIITASPR